jgi:hypothetical protein
MSWRFRKSFKIIPGVKLNLTRRGLSATLGGAPFSINVGPHGTYSNVSIPGTGLSNRTRLDTPAPSVAPPSITPTRPLAPAYSQPVHEIRSASTELLNSASLEDLRKLLKDAYDERADLNSAITTAEYEARTAAARFHGWQNGFLLKRIFKPSFEKRKLAHETAQAKCEELYEQLRLTTIATEMTLDAEQAELYYRMRDDFAAASESQRIWDTLDRRAVNRIAERTVANEIITRDLVQFSLDTCDLIQWGQKVPHLPNRTGGDLYVYPGFVLYRASKQAFALIDSREVTLTHRDIRFIEAEQLPADTRTVGRAWAKSNKDGSPDRRFRDNRQIPIVLYGCLTFTSPTGLEEEFQLSNAGLAARFAEAWNRFHSSFMHQAPDTESARAGFLLPPSVTVPADIPTAFASESEPARKLAIERGKLWSVLLAEELLRTKLAQVRNDYGQFDALLQGFPKRNLSEAEYIDVLKRSMDEISALINRLADCINHELPAGLSPTGEQGDPILLLKAVNDIAEGCRAFIQWELEFQSDTPPEDLRVVGATLRGVAGSVIADVERLPDEFAKIVEGARHGKQKFNVKLTFSSPPQLKEFNREISKLKKHRNRFA